MNCFYIVLVIIVILFLGKMMMNDSDAAEKFQLDHYLRPNYESGANMLRGDLPIVPTQQSWFNTPLATPQNFVTGFF